jgi:hypothetical protein
MINRSDLETAVLNDLIAADDLASAAILQSPADVTISSRCGMAYLDQLIGRDPGPNAEVLMLGYRMLNGLQPGHCEGAILGDIVRSANVIHLLTPYGEYIHAHAIPAAYP